VTDDTLAALAAHSATSKARVSVALVFIGGPAADGCCGIQGPHWERLMDEHSRQALDDVTTRLKRLGCHPVATAVETASSFAEAVIRCVDRWHCDAVMVPAKRHPWSGDGLSRRHLSALRQAAPCEVTELSSRLR